MSADKECKNPATAKQYHEAARRLHQVDGECEVDDMAKVSRVYGPKEGGAYVQAWVWVDREEVDPQYDPCA